MNNQLNLFVLIDALGWTYLQQHDFLCDILPYRCPLRTILGYSSGAIPSILTGVTPAEHGRWNLFYYDPEGSPFRWLRPFRRLPRGFLDNRYSRRLIKELGRRVLGLGPLFECYVIPSLLPWFNWVDKKNIYDLGGIPGAPSIFDRLADQQIPFCVYSYHHGGSDAILLKQATQDVCDGKARFFFVYLCEIDAFLHQRCNDPKQIAERLRWYEEHIRSLFAAAQRVDPEATLTIASDHGMTPVRNHYDLVSDIEKLDLRMPDDYLAVYDSTMARFWFFNSAAREKIVRTLQHVSCGHLLSQDELRCLGISFPDRRYGDLVFLFDPGWIIASGDFNSPSWMPSGMHGFHPDDAYSDAIFLASRRPDFTPHTIVDLYRWMEDLAGLGLRSSEHSACPGA
jgi:hypothetical protein